MGSRCRRGIAVVVIASAASSIAGSPLAHAATYSPRAGFADAKLSAASPQPITVWKPPRWKIRLAAAIAAWNAQAGRTLFERVRSSDTADVDLVDGAGIGWAVACVDATGTFDMYDAYAHCAIYLPVHGASTANLWSLVHEMGHTLGFVDHVHVTEYARYVRWALDPRVCDDPTNVAYSPYEGIMSDCQAAPAFRGDAAALVRAGYAAP
jgi:hypothetical protein